MSIASGFTKMKNYILTSSGYKLLSRWTSSQTVHMGDGTDDTDTVEYRFGAMKGITSSLATDNDEFALSASAGKNLQDQCTQLNQSLTMIDKNYDTLAYTGVNKDTVSLQIKLEHRLADYKNLQIELSFFSTDYNWSEIRNLNVATLRKDNGNSYHIGIVAGNDYVYVNFGFATKDNVDYLILGIFDKSSTWSALPNFISVYGIK